jgi:hypothetical protein
MYTSNKQVLKMVKASSSSWKKVVSSRVSGDVFNRLKMLAESKGDKVGKLVEVAIEQYLNIDTQRPDIQPSGKKWGGELTLLSNKEASEIAKLSIATLNNYRTCQRFKDKGLLEGVHWLKHGTRSIRWNKEPLQHWASNQLKDHQRWLREKLKNG